MNFSIKNMNENLTKEEGPNEDTKRKIITKKDYSDGNSLDIDGTTIEQKPQKPFNTKTFNTLKNINIGNTVKHDQKSTELVSKDVSEEQKLETTNEQHEIIRLHGNKTLDNKLTKTKQNGNEIGSGIINLLDIVEQLEDEPNNKIEKTSKGIKSIIKIKKPVQRNEINDFNKNKLDYESKSKNELETNNKIIKNDKLWVDMVPIDKDQESKDEDYDIFGDDDEDQDQDEDNPPQENSPEELNQKVLNIPDIFDDDEEDDEKYHNDMKQLDKQYQKSTQAIAKDIMEDQENNEEYNQKIMVKSIMI